MKIACVILGTRGDVQPMVALAKGLIEKGHDVTMCAPPENEELVSRINYKAYRERFFKPNQLLTDNCYSSSSPIIILVEAKFRIFKTLALFI